MTKKPASTILALDGEQLLDDLEKLAAISSGTGKGINRVAYTPADREGRDWVERQMRGLGMVVRVDAMGNTIAMYPGSDPGLRPIALGSHTDTVPNGGKYDGALGVLAALACVRTLHTTGVQLRHPIEVINFSAEEATLPGGTFGSRGMVGALTNEMMEQVAWDGRPAVEHLKAAGYDPEQIAQVARPVNSVAAYLELHIEQGGILDSAGVPIGIVLGIVGIRRYIATFQGYANHAGTTPMADRQDALVSAAPFISIVRDVAVRHGIVGTIGTVHVYPGAPNVIPGQVDLTVEIRSLDDMVLDRAAAELAEYASQLGATFKEASNKTQVMSDPQIMHALVSASDELGLEHRTMASGAGHDAMCMAEIGPEAMLFVPSRGGVSHSPDEYTEPEHCVNGARVLLGALLKLDESLDS
jgi:N-carbamoyl-L-amino-acid hydrolase